MIKVRWTEEEAVALFDLYFREGMAKASKLFYRIYEMYLRDNKKYSAILKSFYESYDA